MSLDCKRPTFKFSQSPHETKNSKILYLNRSHLTTPPPKLLLKDFFVHRKSMRDYHILPTQMKYDFLKSLKYQTNVKLPNDELSVEQLRHYKVVRTFRSNQLPLTARSVKALLRMIKYCNKTIESFSLSFKKFDSLTIEQCLQFHIQICSYLKRLKRITSLELILAKISKEVMECIALSMDCFENLKDLALDLPSDHLDWAEWQYIVNALKQKPQLKYLRLRLPVPEVNEGKGIKMFDCLQSLNSLEELFLTINHRAENNFLSFSNNSVLELGSLKKFTLRVWSGGNNLTNLDDLCSHLRFPNLTHLEFFASNLQDSKGTAFTSMKELIQGSVGLIDLSIALKTSFLMPESYTVLGQLVQPTLKNLRLLIQNQTFHSSHISNLFKLFDSLSKLNKLSLDFGNGNINCSLLEKITSSLINFTQLKQLDLNLNSNLIQDQGIASLANLLISFSELTDLSLNLADNKFTVVGLHDLLEPLKMFAKLSYIYLNVKDCRYLNPTVKVKTFGELKALFPYLRQGKDLFLEK